MTFMLLVNYDPLLEILYVCHNCNPKMLLVSTYAVKLNLDQEIFKN